ncbi:MAG: glycosyltransferase family 2 protein [Thermoguttaceae bacterium]
MPRLSIIIPVPGDLKGLEETLLSVLENRPKDCQIVVVISGNYDDPYGLAGEVDFVRAGRGIGLIGCINAGICASRAPVVHPLLCGVKVGPGWADIALARFDDPVVAAVAPLVLDGQNPPRVVAAGVTYRWAGIVRSIGRGLSPEDALRRCPVLRDPVLRDPAAYGPDISAGFYRKAVLRRFGLFDAEAGDLLSTLDMTLAMRRAGLGCAIEPRCLTYVGQAPTVSMSPLQRGRQIERLFWRWLPRRGRLGSVASHALIVLAECLQCVVRPTVAFRLVGRLLGMLTALVRPDWREIPESVLTTSANLTPPHFAAQTERSSAA